MANSALKKCPICNSISQDSDSSCGVCGGDLSGIASASLASFEAVREQSFQPKKKVSALPVLLLLTGLTVIGLGAYLLFASGFIGLVLLLAGVTITASILGVTGSTFGTRGGGKGSGGKSTGRAGKDYTVRREREEVIESENKKKGVKD
jgi:hypothetical protein